MGQFKPMVKMMTTEPSVILKLKKGGKVSKMAIGGNDFVPMQSAMTNGMPSMASPMGMAPKKPSMAMRRKAMNPLMMAKKGGEAEGGKMDKSQDKAMIKKAFKQHDMQEHKGDKGTSLKLKKGGKMATGGVAMGNGGGYKTGGVALGNGGGYKKGGMTMVKKNGKMVPDFAADGKGKMATGGVALGNGGGYKMGGKASKKAFAMGGTVDTGKPVAMPKKPTSKPVANSLQSGTFAKGGKVDYYTDLAKRLQKNPEKPNLRLVKTHTGPKGHVAKVYKDKDYGEYRTKFYSPEGKHLTEADSHTDDAEDAHMTAKSEVNKGSYKKGGKISHKANGGLQDLSKGAYDEALKPDASDMDMARSIRNIPSKLFEGAKTMMGMGAKSAGAGRGFVNPKSVTETQKSVTVTPRKRGGKAC
jgi:hypothetical protein